jgi:cell division initiation protein
MLSPLDIHNREFKKSLRGYDEADVDAFLDQVIRDFETLYRENTSLKERSVPLKKRFKAFKFGRIFEKSLW